MQVNYRVILFTAFLCFLDSFAQLENPIFNGTFNSIDRLLDTSLHFMKLKEDPEKFGIQALHYLKNNEYMERHNPGETFFGLQLAMGTVKYISNPKTKLYLGVMANIPYGEQTKTTLYPLVQFSHQFSPSKQLIMGSIHGNTRHRIYEPMYNYELNLNQPVEYGIQYLSNGPKFRSDLWLNWRQQAILDRSQQEIISFGWSTEYLINPKNTKHTWSIPMNHLVYHKGGESLLQGKPIHNQWNGSLGIKYAYARFLSFETSVFGAYDFSPEMQHSFKDGHAWYSQVGVSSSASHRWVLSHYYGEEFYAPLGPNLFLSEQINKPYNFEHYRNFLMLRYQWMGIIIPEICSFDIRIEPIWHLEKNHFAFSTGFYLKYIIGSELH